MKYALKIGGSLIFKDDGEINEFFLKKLVTVMKKIQLTDHDLIIIIGGGKVARKYIDVTRNFNASEEICDLIGITASRLNAKLIISLEVDLFNPQVPTDIETAIGLLSSTKEKKFVVMGGLIPGQSTNAVAAQIAEQWKADAILNATDVDHVYTADPKVDPDAKPLKKLSYEEFSKYVDKEAKAGKYKLFDYRAFKIIERSKIKTHMFSGRNPDNIFRIINGVQIGTVITE